MSILNFLFNATLVSKFNSHFPLNKSLHIKFQIILNLAVFNAIFMRKEPVNYKCKITFHA